MPQSSAARDDGVWSGAARDVGSGGWIERRFGPEQEPRPDSPSRRRGDVRELQCNRKFLIPIRKGTANRIDVEGPEMRR